MSSAPGYDTPADARNADEPAGAALWGLIDGIAGRLVDDSLLLLLRLTVATGEIRTAAALLADAAASGPAPLTRTEYELLARIANALRLNLPHRSADFPQEVAERPHRFSAPAFDDADGDAEDEVVVLAAAGAAPAASDTDASGFALALPDGPMRVRALWRVQRTSDSDTVDVRLVELDRTGDAIQASAAASTALVAYGVDLPCIEVFTEDAALTAYQHAALSEAALVWAAEEPEPATLVPVFDRVDGTAGVFDTARPRMTGRARAQVLTYLREATTLLAGTDLQPDDVTGEQDRVPTGFRTDGHWIWSTAVEYYLDHHSVAPDSRLLVQALSSPPRRATRVERAFALEHILELLQTHAPRHDDDGAPR